MKIALVLMIIIEDRLANINKAAHLIEKSSRDEDPGHIMLQVLCVHLRASFKLART